MKYFFLVVGKSGSGKDTLINSMTEHGFKKILSYTTRNQRKGEENTHTFVSRGVFSWLMDAMVAYSEFDGNKYGATEKQVEENDILTIDPDGIEYFKDNYEGDKQPIIIYITASPSKRFWRMLKRGDGPIKAIKRIINDYRTFSILDGKREFHSYAVYHISNDDTLAKGISRLYSVLTHFYSYGSAWF